MDRGATYPLATAGGLIEVCGCIRARHGLVTYPLATAGGLIEVRSPLSTPATEPSCIRWPRLAASLKFDGVHGTGRSSNRGRRIGHSLRVGSARELAADGASLVELQQAGGWRSPTTPAVYVRRESATRGPVARRRYGVGQ